jgi:hypothetical protein
VSIANKKNQALPLIFKIYAFPVLALLLFQTAFLSGKDKNSRDASAYKKDEIPQWKIFFVKNRWDSIQVKVRQQSDGRQVFLIQGDTLLTDPADTIIHDLFYFTAEGEKVSIRSAKIAERINQYENQEIINAPFPVVLKDEWVKQLLIFRGKKIPDGLRKLISFYSPADSPEVSVRKCQLDEDPEKEILLFISDTHSDDPSFSAYACILDNQNGHWYLCSKIPCVNYGGPVHRPRISSDPRELLLYNSYGGTQFISFTQHYRFKNGKAILTGEYYDANDRDSNSGGE